MCLIHFVYGNWCFELMLNKAGTPTSFWHLHSSISQNKVKKNYRIINWLTNILCMRNTPLNSFETNSVSACKLSYSLHLQRHLSKLLKISMKNTNDTPFNTRHSTKTKFKTIGIPHSGIMWMWTWINALSIFVYFLLFLMFFVNTSMMFILMFQINNSFAIHYGRILIFFFS